MEGSERFKVRNTESGILNIRGREADGSSGVDLKLKWTALQK